MKLYISNKFFSLRGSSYVLDENSKEIFKVKGKFFSFTKKKFVKDLDNKTLYMVRNKFFRFFLNSAYIYDGNKNKILKITRKFSFKSNYKITGYTSDFRIDGDFWGWDFKIYKGEEVIGSIARRFDVFKDRFALECYNDNDAALLVAFVIAIDNIVDNNNDQAR